MPNLKGSEWLIIILLIVLLFGAKRLPDAARGLGRSLRIFKAETKGLTTDSATPPPAVPSAAPVVDPVVPPAEQLPSAAPAPAQHQPPQPPVSA